MAPISNAIPENLKQRLFSDFIASVQMKLDEEDVLPHVAISNYCMDLWGLTEEDGAIRSDGKGDRGIDWYRIEQHTAEIWQHKGTKEINQTAFSALASPSDLSDLRRIVDYVKTINELKVEQNKSVQRFQNACSLAIKSAGDSEESTFYFNINYCIAKDRLTAAAQSELDEIKQSASQAKSISGVKISISIDIHLIGDILSEIWRQTNESWSSISGRKEDWITLSIDGKVIDDQRCQVFFASASDLIAAYSDLGQRLFAPNVRCYLKDTSVNTHIKEAVKTTKGIDNFKYMNNGITIVAENIDKGKLASNRFRIRKPGVINGLQTIRSLYESYQSMTSEEKEYFGKRCHVLVRVFGESSKNFQIEDLIIATNNQNKMEARNLKSNSYTQKIIEGNFADLGWFYERKERAWDAFIESDGKWDSLRGKKPSHFGGKPKPTRRNVDNTVVATSFLSFSGFSDIARNKKSQIFSDDRLYKRIFESQLKKHGYDFNYSYSTAVEADEVVEIIPAASEMLLSALVYLTSKQITPSSADIKFKFAKKLKIENEPPEKQQSYLLDDPEYLASLMLCSSPLLMTEVYGYLFSFIDVRERSNAAKKSVK
jgi:hypothetical protein